MVGKTAADERRQGPSRRGRFDAIRGYVGIGRPANAAAIASFTLVGAYVGGGRDAVSMAAAAATTVTLLSAFGGYAINDYVDRDVDRINDPDRPIPRGAVAPVGALAVTAVAFGLAAVVAGVVLPLAAGVIVATQLVALVVYTPWVKGTYGLGNLLISALVGSAALLGGTAVESVEPVVVMALLAFQMLFGLELLKDVEDLAGDAAAGLRTLPIVFGRRRAIHLILVVLFLTVPLSLIPYFRGTFGLAYLGVIVVANALTGVTMWKTVSASPATALRWIKVAMLVCMAAFMAGRML